MPSTTQSSNGDRGHSKNRREAQPKESSANGNARNRRPKFTRKRYERQQPYVDVSSVELKPDYDVLALKLSGLVEEEDLPPVVTQPPPESEVEATRPAGAHKICQEYPLQYRLLVGQNVRLHAGRDWTRLNYETVERVGGVVLRRHLASVVVPSQTVDAIKAWATTFAKTKDFDREAMIYAQYLLGQYDYDSEHDTSDMILALAYTAAKHRAHVNAVIYEEPSETSESIAKTLDALARENKVEPHMKEAYLKAKEWEDACYVASEEWEFLNEWWLKKAAKKAFHVLGRSIELFLYFIICCLIVAILYVNFFSQPVTSRPFPPLDLTRYGIEPNPGPLTNQLFRDFGRQLCIVASIKLAPMRDDCQIRLPRRGVDWLGIKTSCMAPDSTGFRPIHFSKNAWNEYSSIRNRVVCELPPHDPNWVHQFGKWVERHHNKFFRGCKVESHEIMGFDDWVASSNSKPTAKLAYRRAHQELQEAGLDHNSRLTAGQISDFTLRKTFMKVENLLYRTPYGTKDKSPRNISGADPRFMVLCGPWFKTLQNKVKARWNTSFCMTMSSGLSSVEMGRWCYNHREGHIGEDDVSKFDVSIHEALLEIEARLFKRLGAPRAVDALVRSNIRTRAKTSQGFYYETPDGRKSGDPYTSLGNTILNGLMHLFLYCRHHRCTVHTAMRELHQLLQGDDNVLVSTRFTPFNKLMAKLGFESEFISRKDMLDVSFCSAYVLPFEGGYALVPNPYRVLMKFGVFVGESDDNYHDLCATSAKGLYNLLSWFPPAKSIFDAAINRGKILERKVEDWQLWNSKPLVATPLTWFHVHRKFGPEPEGEAGWHRQYERNTDGPTAFYSNQNFLGSAVWVPDLTEEGIEPHPGPRTRGLIVSLSRRFDQYNKPTSETSKHGDWTKATSGKANPKNTPCFIHSNGLIDDRYIGCPNCDVPITKPVLVRNDAPTRNKMLTAWDPRNFRRSSYQRVDLNPHLIPCVREESPDREPQTAPPSPVNWGISHRLHNAAMHALNGNIKIHNSPALADQAIQETVSRGYAAALADPFGSVPPSLGFGDWDSNSAVFSVYKRLNSTLSSEGCGVILVNPNAWYSPTSGPHTTSLLTAAISRSKPDTAGSPIGSTNVAFPATNGQSVYNTGRTYRILSCGFRVLVGQAMTAVPGRVCAGRLPGVATITDLDGSSVNGFFELPQSRTFMPQGGVATIQQEWYPSDYADLSFADTALVLYQNPNGCIQPLYCAFAGFPPDTPFYVEVVWNVEVQYGALTAGVQGPASVQSQSKVVDYIASPDQLMAKASRHIDPHAHFSTSENYVIPQSANVDRMQNGDRHSLPDALEWGAEVVGSGKKLWKQLQPIASGAAKHLTKIARFASRLLPALV